MRPLLFAILLSLAAPAVASATPEAQGSNCFLSTNWRGWSAPGDGNTLYLRVGLHDVYSVGLTPGTHVNRNGNRFLINRARGSAWVCSPLDLDLTLNDRNGIEEPLIARSLHKLTAAEIAALPPRDTPY